MERSVPNHVPSRNPAAGEITEDLSLLEEIRRILGNVSMKSSEAFVGEAECCTIRYRAFDSTVGNANKYHDLAYLRGKDGMPYEQEQDWIEVEQLLRNSVDIGEEGPELFHMLYAYRSCAKAIPQPGTDADEATKMEMYRRTLRVLQPEVDKILKICEYHEVICDQIKCLLERISMKRDVVRELILEHVTNLLDIVVILDHLKDSKPCLRNDFALYKRALHVLRRELDDYDKHNAAQMKIQQFLSNPRCAKGGVILFHLQDKLAATRNIVDTLCELFSWCASKLVEQELLLPQEKWTLLRVLPHVLIPLDSIAAGVGPADEKNNIFKSKKLFTAEVVKLFKRNPVVPVFADLQMNVNLVLQRCPTFVALESLTADLSDPKVAACYDLNSQWKDLRTEYDVFLNRFAGTMRQLGVAGDHTAQEVYEVILDGVKFLGRCKEALVSQAAFKYATPVSLETLDPSEVARASHAGFEYERVVRLHYSRTDLLILIDVISMLKTVSATLANNEAAVSPMLRTAIHAQVSNFLTHELPGLFPKAESKKKKAMTEALESMSAIFGDRLLQSAKQESMDQVPPANHFAASSSAPSMPKAKKKTASKMVSIARKKVGFRSGSSESKRNLVLEQTAIPAEETTICAVGEVAKSDKVSSVAPCTSQLELLRSLASSLIEDFEGTSKGSKGFGLFSVHKDSTQKGVVRALFKFCFSLRAAEPLLDLRGTVDSLSNLGELWFREFFLDITKSAQFPIDMSLPWILAKEIVERPSNHTVRALFQVMDIYNDAADLVFAHLRQQFLFDEIEAEVNLAMDQLLYLLPTHVYGYLKSKAAFEELDGRYRDKVEKFCASNSKKTSPFGREKHCAYEKIINQRQVKLLGRSLDFAGLLSERLNAYIKDDISTAVDRFLSSSLCGVIELESQLQVIRKTHELTSALPGIQVEPFPALLMAANGNNKVSSSSLGRIAGHVLSEILMDVLPNFSLNAVTDRLLCSKETMSQPVDRTPKPKLSAPYLLYGSSATRWFDILHRRERGYLGENHMDALVSVLEVSELASILEQLLAELEFKVERAIVPLVKLLCPKIPKVRYRDLSDARKCFVDLQSAYGPLLSEDKAMRPKVCQAFREFGNAVVLVQMIESALHRKELRTFVQVGPVLGFDDVQSLGTGKDSTAAPELANTAMWRAFSESGADKENLRIAKRVYEWHDEVHRSTPLLQRFLERIDEILISHIPEESNELDEENGFAFCKFWNMLQFSLLSCTSEDVSLEGQSGNAGEEEGSFQVLPMARYGDGFAWAGATLLHRLGLDRKFMLWDGLRVISEAHELDNASFLSSDGANEFISSINHFRGVNKTVLNLLSNVLPCTRTKKPFLYFHPPVPNVQVDTSAGEEKCSDAKNPRRGRSCLSVRLTQLEYF